jgi:hypothetical protein
VITLTPLHPGTIRDIFAGWRLKPTQARKTVDPLELPSNPLQCIHVDILIDESTGAVSYSRCFNEREYYQDTRNGWLCEHHNDQLDLAFPPRVRFYRRTPDQDVIGHIKLTEAKALASGGREVVRHGKLSIQFVAGVRMKQDAPNLPEYDYDPLG